MPKRVLSIGQCAMDHGSIARIIQERFSAAVTSADLPDEALAELQRGGYDLVLVNRKLDADGSDGLAVIRHIKADPALRALPVMLVTNYPEHQQTAVAAGAEQGFGKLELAQPATREKLARFLG